MVGVGVLFLSVSKGHPIENIGVSWRRSETAQIAVNSS